MQSKILTEFYILSKSESRPKLQQTKTSRLSDQLIEDSMPVLRDLTSKLFGKKLDKLTPQSKKKIMYVFRNYIITAYTLGQKYNNKFNKIETPLTKADIDRINEITKSALMKYLKSISRPKVKEYFPLFDFLDFDQLDDVELDDMDLDFPELEDEYDLDILDELQQDALLSGDYDTVSKITSIRTAPTANVSIVKTWNGITINVGIDKKLEISNSALDRISSDMIINGVNQGTVSNTKNNLVQYVTRRDDRVCPICEDLDGNIYEVDPITKIIIDGVNIPEDTHTNCRCRYLAVDDNGDVLIG
ncbi:MAG: phage minor head protein [Candidatus Nitrosotenuis sp.]